jgi:hypothetical protein
MDFPLRLTITIEFIVNLLLVYLNELPIEFVCELVILKKVVAINAMVNVN